MGKLTSIEGYKAQLEKVEKALDFNAVNVWCENCGSGLFSWKMDADNPSSNLLVCSTCQSYYPIFDLTDLLEDLGDSEDDIV